MSKPGSMRIKLLSLSARTDMISLEDWAVEYDEEELVEMLNRYTDAQLHAKAYRDREREKIKLMRAELKRKGVDVGEL